MGASGVDVQLSQSALAAFPFSVECKNRASIAVYSDFDQCAGNTIDGTTPLLVIKQNHSEPLAVLRLEDFMSLVTRVKEAK